MKRLIAGTLRLEHIERELRAQIEYVLAAGMRPTHLDGHQHIQAWPPIFAIIVKLALAYGIRGIRISAERMVNLSSVIRTPSPVRFLHQFTVGRALAWLSRGQRVRAWTAGLASPSYCYGITQTGLLSVTNLEVILRSIPEGSSEILCHPGYADRELGTVSTRLQQQREAEVHTLTHSSVMALTARLNLTLGTYRDVRTECI